MFNIVNRYYVPAPSDILSLFLRKLYETRPDGATIVEHTLESLSTVLVGFLISVGTGIPLGLFMGWKRWIEDSSKPLFDIIRQIPPVAWIPFSILWFGLGVYQRAFITWLSAFVPAVINSYYGIKNVDKVYVNIARVFGFSEWEIFRKVLIPASQIQIWTGLTISLGISWFVLVAAEMFASSRGLGYMIWMAARLGRSDLVALGMLIIGLVGFGLGIVLRSIERYAIKWKK